MAAAAGGRFFIISGPGGVGKDTIVSRLLAQDDSLWLSRSWTTRDPRPGEPADAYTFVDRDTFEAEIERGGFLEWAEYGGQLYGTPRPHAPPAKDVLLVIEIQGARQILERVPNSVMILIVPPSRAHQAERLRGRGDDDTQVAKRLALAVEEERLGRELSHQVVVNDDLARAVGEVAGILADARARPEGA